MGRGEVTAHEPGMDRPSRWDEMKRTLRHVMIALAILGVGAALMFFVLADVMCIGDFCSS